jgi:hypothetical protein
MATTGQLAASSDGNSRPVLYEHLLDLLKVAALSQAGFFFLNDGIDEAPLRLTYAELLEHAKASTINHPFPEQSLMSSAEIWHYLARVWNFTTRPDCPHVFRHTF